jgi:hypothetical protein
LIFSCSEKHGFHPPFGIQEVEVEVEVDETELKFMCATWEVPKRRREQITL